MTSNWQSIWRRQVTVARVYGIPVCIDYRWFLVFALSVLLIATNLQQGALRLVTPSFIESEFRLLSFQLQPVGLVTAWILSLVTTVALFLSVFGHELSHALMGRAEGIEIEEIVLHPFGGLARLRREPETPGAEFRIAIAGPAASFLFAGFAFVGMGVAGMLGRPAAIAVFFFLSTGNFMLAVFNLFPGYPLDGGRVLRALIWKRTGNINEATRLASLGGQIIAALLVVFGGYVAMAWQAYFMGLWSILIGVFLWSAAVSVMNQRRAAATVAEIMKAPVAIAAEMPVSAFVDTILVLHRQTVFPVTNRERLLGLLTLEDLKSHPRENWRQLKVRDVMRPIEPSLFIEATAASGQAREIVESNGVGAVAVVDSRGFLVGMIHRSGPVGSVRA